MKQCQRQMLLLLLLLFFSFTARSFAALDVEKDKGGRNPFLTQQEQEAGLVKIKQETPGSVQLNLQAVFISSEKKIALINGRILREAELIENNRIVSICSEEVVLKTIAGEIMVIKLPAVIEKEGK